MFKITDFAAGMLVKCVRGGDITKYVERNCTPWGFRKGETYRIRRIRTTSLGLEGRDGNILSSDDGRFEDNVVNTEIWWEDYRYFEPVVPPKVNEIDDYTGERGVLDYVDG